MAEIPPVQDFSEYPRLPVAPRIRFEAISEAWKLFQAEMGTWILAVFLFFLITFLSIAPFYAVAFAQVIGVRQPQPGDILRMYAILLPGVFISYVVQSIGLAGLFNLAMKQVNGQAISIKDFFSTGGSIFSHMGAALLSFLAIFIGALFCYLPGLLAGGLLMFIHPIIVHRRLGATDAIKESFRILKPQMWMALGFYLVIGIVGSIGSLLCGIGVLFSYPLFPLSIAIIYRDFAWAIHEGYDPSAPVVPYDIRSR